jgi:hypothetical protein
MKKDITIKKECGIKLKQVQEGLRTSNDTAGWNARVDNGMRDFEVTLNRNENLFFNIEQEQKIILNSN